MKTKHNGGGPFDPPSGQVSMETPDGVSRTFGGGQVRNSLTNAEWACGGSQGGGYGAFPREDDSSITIVGVPFGPPGGRAKFRID